MHNEFLLCIITKCNNFSSIVSEAATKAIYPSMSQKTSQKSKKRFKTEPGSSGPKSAAYHLRFVPVDSIKHAPSILASSIETACASTKDFSIEFCARERSLPYFKMIHNRILLGAIDYNLQHVDIKAVFLVAEATVWMLKNIISKLSSRSNFKHDLRRESAYSNFVRKTITDKKILKLHQEKMKSDDQLDIDPNIFRRLRNKHHEIEEEESESEEINKEKAKIDLNELGEKEHLKNLGSYLNNPAIVPSKKLPATLFDLNNLLKVKEVLFLKFFLNLKYFIFFKCHRDLMPSHSIYTINMEKIICSMSHENETLHEENFTE